MTTLYVIGLPILCVPVYVWFRFARTTRLK